MKSCLILTSHIEGIERLQVRQSDYDAVLAADGGYVRAEELGLVPDAFIGDYDSSDPPQSDGETVFLPREKDMTDSEAAIDLALSRGYDRIFVLGGLGGRFDHTMGNVSLLLKYQNSADWLEFKDGFNRVFLAGPGTCSVPADRYQYLGLIAYGGPVCGLTVQGTKYPLSDFTLPDDTTLGVSNEIQGERAELSFSEGRLLVIQSNDMK